MHIPVLLTETVDLMNLKEGEIVVDGTLGSGGHASEISKRIGDRGVYVGLDVDADAIERSGDALQGNAAATHLIKENFRHVDRALKGLGINEVDAVLFDLGWSSDQFEKSGRGFSFGSDEPLIMTLEKDSEESVTARDLVNSLPEDELADIIYTLGEEQFSRRIAAAIVEARRTKRIETTKELVTLIEKAVPKFYLFRRIHPATKTFQALRIKVNDELGALREGLEKGYAVLKKGGRFAIITFHSLEDRIVKQTFREWAHEGRGSVLTKKPIVAGAEEIERNKRSRSAKLRGFLKA